MRFKEDKFAKVTQQLIQLLGLESPKLSLFPLNEAALNE